MTEEKWREGKAPTAMLDFLLRRKRASNRKLRLLVCGLSRIAGVYSAMRTIIDSTEDTTEASQVKKLIEEARQTNAYREVTKWLNTLDLPLMTSCIVGTQQKREHGPRAELVREVFDNPFRPATIKPACRTPTVASLARAAYEERQLPSGHLESARLAVLADALEDAGCTEESILAHLRSPGPHVRGCWAVDLILGRD
jgi:hypothetical protein